MYPLKPYKKHFPYSYTIGVFPTLELITHQINAIDRILIHSLGKRNKGVQKIQAICEEKHLPLEINDRAINKLANKSNIYAIGVFRKIKQSLHPRQNHLVLLHPESMGNLGTIMRTMLGFEYENLAIIQPAADIYSPKTIRASMGAIFQLRVGLFKNLSTYFAMYQHHPFFITGNGTTSLRNIQFQNPFSLVFGSESQGLGSSLIQQGPSIYIPQSNRIDSFNLAIAVGITLYQANTLK